VSPALSRNLFKIITFGVLWSLGGLMFTLLEFGVIGDLDYYPSTGVSYDVSNNIITTPIISFFGGALLMIADILVINKRIMRKSFLTRITIKAVFFFFIILITTLISAIIGTSITLNRPPFDAEVMDSLAKFFGNFAFWSIQIYAGFVTILYLFIVEVSETLGYKVFWNFFTGRYQKSKVEERIFMFMDLKNSTAIAEQLGHEKYFEFLNQFFEDIGKSILNSWGAIYQYVGDEVVVHWDKGKALQSLQCFQAIREKNLKNAKLYKSSYGVIPEFRAGIHGGQAAIGEVGSIKKDILYIGDVLNTASRIQVLCKTLDVELLVSEYVVEQVKQTKNKQFRFNDQGITELRGKEKQVRLFTVETA
jgi:adenylate cyclase